MTVFNITLTWFLCNFKKYFHMVQKNKVNSVKKWKTFYSSKTHPPWQNTHVNILPIPQRMPKIISWYSQHNWISFRVDFWIWEIFITVVEQWLEFQKKAKITFSHWENTNCISIIMMALILVMLNSFVPT